MSAEELAFKAYKVSELAEGVFVSPFHIFRLAEYVGVEELSKARKGAKLKLHEMWVTALFSLGLKKSKHFVSPEFYISLVDANAPDTRVFIIDPGQTKPSQRAGWERLEITRYEKNSDDIKDVLGKKLKMGYDSNTRIIVWINKRDELAIAEIDNFVKKHNVNNFKVFILSFTEDAVELMPLFTARPSELGADYRKIKLIQFQYRERERSIRNRYGALELSIKQNLSTHEEWFEGALRVQDIQLSL